SALTLRLAGQVVITGAVVSTTVMSAVQVVALPATSLTVIVTVVVVPSATTVPAAGLCVMVNAPAAAQFSVATTSPVRSGIWPAQAPSALTLRLAGQVVITGAVVSVTVMSAVQVVALPATSVTVIVTVVVVPSATTVPAVGLCVMINAPAVAQFSVATTSPVRSGI